MKNSTPFLLLILRLMLFALFQSLLALFFYIIHTENAWSIAQGWWIIPGLFTNTVTYVILVRYFHKRGVTYFSNFKFIKKDWWKDVLFLIGFLIITIPISTFPNTFISNLLYGSTDITLHLFFRPIPYWLIFTGFFWAITQGVVELPFYFSYLMPRIESITNNSLISWVLASFFLALQHITLPLIFDIRFMVWRFGMFFIFAFFIGFCIKWKRHLLPYLMIIHALMDISAVAMLFVVK